MEVSLSWMNLLALIGAFLRNMLIFRKRIRNMRYWRTLIVLSNTKRILISKIIPSFFTIKEGSTFLTKPLFPQGREDVTALRCSEPLRYKVSGPIKGLAMLCGLGPPGDSSLQLIVYSLRLISWLFADNLQISCDFLGGFEKKMRQKLNV